MTKKTYTTLFIIISSIINVLCTLVLIGAIIALATVILHLVIDCKDPQIYMVVYMLSFIAGMIANMFIFGKLSRYVVEKHNLASKLDHRMLGRGFFANNQQAQAAMRQEEENKPKTVMPDSVLEDDDDKWAEE